MQLTFVREHYGEFVATAANEQWDHLPLLARLVEGEAAQRRDRAIARRIRLARFPVKKTLDAFDWTWPKKINRQQMMNLFRLHFVEQANNVIFVAGVGLGTSHLAIALGLRACEERYSVLFGSAIDIVNTLAATQAADLLFQITSQRYESGSTVITTNRVNRKWPEIFNNDATQTSAVLARLLHAETVVMEGSCFRMKDANPES